MLPLLLPTNINPPLLPRSPQVPPLLNWKNTMSTINELDLWHCWAYCVWHGSVLMSILKPFSFLFSSTKFEILKKQSPHVFFFMYTTLTTPYLAQGPVYNEYLINVSLFSITGPWLWIKFANQQTKSEMISQIHVCVYNICTLMCKYVYAYICILYLHIYSFLHIHIPVCVYIYISTCLHVC